MRRAWMVAAAFVLALASPALAQPISAAVISDPAPDPAHPPHQTQLLVPSAGLGMNAQIGRAHV